MILKMKTLAILFFAFGFNVVLTSFSQGFTWEGLSHFLSGVIIFCIAFYLYFAGKNIAFVYRNEGEQ